MANQNNGKTSVKYVGAPYNFVPFTEKVYPYPEGKLPQRHCHDHSDGRQLLTGEINYKVSACTPVFIGSGDKEGNFYRNAYGEYAIPGSSMRGMIRSNVQILSLSSMGDDVDDYALMYREVGSRQTSKLKKHYDSILGTRTVPIDGRSMSILKNVRAGYIRNENGKYYIYDTVVESIGAAFGSMNYYILSERTISKNYHDAIRKKELEKFAYGYLYNEDNNILQFDISRGFEKKYMNDDYVPFEKACSYEVKGKDVLAVGDPDALSHKGYVVGTGKMMNKKAIYIIPEIDEAAEPIIIPEKDVHAFEVDYKKRESTLGDLKDHFNLPGEGKTRPVFYIQEGSRLYFGFTPRLRIFYDNTVHDGINPEHFRKIMDYGKALFGYSDKDSKTAYKSRVSFSDAIIVGGAEPNVHREYAILSEPKPTSYHDYIIPEEGNARTYNDKGFKLRGVKQYWLHRKASSMVPEKHMGKPYVSKFNVLPQGVEFTGKVRFQNLSESELGLLLWGLRLNKNSMMNIGKGKAYGFGNILLEVGEVRILDQEAGYSLETFNLHPWKRGDADALIDVFRNELKVFLNGKEPEAVEPIKTLMRMKNGKVLPDPDYIRFMNIDDKEYQNREPLDTAEQVIRLHRIKEKAQLVEGQVYEAIVKKAARKLVRFALSGEEKGYGSFNSDQIEIEGRSISKKEMGTVFAKGTMIKVKCISSEEDREEWICVEV